MKGLYLSNIDPIKSIGYTSKILGQAKGFYELGAKTAVLSFNLSGQAVLIEGDYSPENLVEIRMPSKGRKSLFRRRCQLLRKAILYIEKESPTFLYIRYPRAEPLYLLFLAKVSRKFPQLIILGEFPTYPYDKEYESFSSLKDRLVLFLDRLTRSYLKRYIDRIVSINYEKPILGIDTISIDNGVNVSDYAQVVPHYPVTSPPINLIGVANVSSWHGYDRLIRGLGEYYQKFPSPIHKIVFHIVGARAPYLSQLIALATDENVSQYIIFHDSQQGKSLDNLFNECCLAVGVLGGHRKELEIMSPLKNREYCARGIPFVLSHTDPDFLESFQYCLHVESSDRPIDIERLIEFVSRLNSQSEIACDMRDYAREKLNWAVKLNPVKAYIDSQSSKLSTEK